MGPLAIDFRTFSVFLVSLPTQLGRNSLGGMVLLWVKHVKKTWLAAPLCIYWIVWKESNLIEFKDMDFFDPKDEKFLIRTCGLGCIQI